jgi:hypothetical protein
MLNLLLVTLGTWSVVSLFLVGTLGSLIHVRQQRACAMGGSTVVKTAPHAVATRGTPGSPAQFLNFPRNPLCSTTVEALEAAGRYELQKVSQSYTAEELRGQIVAPSRHFWRGRLPTKRQRAWPRKPRRSDSTRDSG